MNDYSEDLRKKIALTLHRNMGKSQAARTFSVSLSSIKRYASCRRGKLSVPHHPDPLELVQALGEDVGARLGYVHPQVGEALGAEQQLAHYEQRPSLSREVQSVGGAPITVCSPGRHAQDFTAGSPDSHLFRRFY
jgi:hypothetical protein